MDDRIQILLDAIGDSLESITCPDCHPTTKLLAMENLEFLTETLKEVRNAHTCAAQGSN